MTDVLVVLAMALLAVDERFWDWCCMHSRHAVVLAIVAVVALIFRRAVPVGVLLLIASISFVQYAFLGGGADTADWAIVVAVFTVAALRGPWWGVVAVAAEVVAYARACGVACQAGWATWMVVAVIAGLAVRESRRLNQALAKENEVLRQTREERIRIAVNEERTRIARDVHDFVAHGVTLMVIQAGAARWLAETDPLRADRALATVERAGQEALGELRSLVGSLGPGSVERDDPLPAGEHLSIPSLVDEVNTAGMDVELVTRGDPRDLDPGLEASLYRIVQEALTNVRKHAPGASVGVVITYAPEGVEVEVTDSGGGNLNGYPRTVPGAGQGLVGIAERAALFGGHSEAGPTTDGGFRVRATLHGGRVLV